jgi:hypothetical protein
MMDWDALYEGLEVWAAKQLGVDPSCVLWAGAPEGMRDFPHVDLSLRSHVGVHGDEVRTTAREDGDMDAEAVGNRRMVLSIRVRARDQAPTEQAFFYLERLRDRLELESSHVALADLGVGVIEVFQTVDLSPVANLRQESEATLDIALSYSSCVSDGEPAGTITSVEMDGEAVDGSTTIIIPETTVETPAP